MTTYYVYAYLRSSDNTPYYIGKGKGPRATLGKHSVSVPNDRSKIKFLQTNLEEDVAFYFEKAYIKLFGRKDNNTGILLNKTDGGGGTPASIRPKHGDKIRKAISEGRMNHIYKSVPHTEETKQKLRTPKKNKENYQNRKWYHSKLLKKEACVNTIPDWPDVASGRLPKAFTASA